MENGPPLVLWQEIDEEFHVKETGRVRAIVRTSYLVYDLWHFRKRGQDLPGTVRNLIAPSSKCGRNSEPITPLKARKPEIIRRITAVPTVIQRWRMAHRTSFR